jgi:hypothetical protein
MCADSVLAFAGMHPVVATILGVCIIGNATRLLVAIVKYCGN